MISFRSFFSWFISSFIVVQTPNQQLHHAKTLLKLSIRDVPQKLLNDTKQIDALANSGKKGSATQAEKILADMEQRYDEGERDIKPDTITYSAVINSLAKSNELDGPERAEAVLRNMLNRFIRGEGDVKPDTISFTSVIDAWANSGD